MKPIIESLQNAKIKQALRLRESRGRKKAGLILIDGVREIRAAQAAGVALEIVFYPSTREACQPLAEFPLDVQQPVHEHIFEKLAYGQRTAGAVAVAQPPSVGWQRIEAAVRSTRSPLLLVLDQTEKPGNIGAVARSAAAAGVTGLILVDPRCDVFNPNAIRASLGTVFSLPLAVTSLPQLADWLSDHRISMVCARVDAQASMWEADLTGPVAIALGSEAWGLSDAWRREPWRPIAIPMIAGADSLNLSVSAAVLCYEALAQRHARHLKEL